MPTIDEILAAMPEPAAEGDHEYLVIDPVKRAITVPEAEKIFGVTGDELADRKYFICPRIVGDGLDLASMFIRVNYRNAGGDEDGYLVTDVAVSGDYVTFSWQLWPKVVAYKGEVMFSVCADLPNTPGRKMPDWNTTMASGDVLEGLDPDLGDVEGETSDVVTQLRAETAAQTAAVEACGAAQVKAVEAAADESTADAKAQIEAKGEAVRASIPEDYTTLANTVDRLAHDRAAAIVCDAEGETVQVTDASADPLQGLRIFGRSTQDGDPTPDNPVDIVSLAAPVVGVYSKNLLCADSLVNGQFVKNADGTYTLTKNGTGGLRFSNRAACNLPKGAYTFSVRSATGTDETVRMALTYANGGEQSLAATPSTPKTFVATDRIVKMAAYLPSDKADGDYTTMGGLMLELGNVATDYEPYKEPQTLTVITPAGLPGIPVASGGNYTDADGQQWIADEVDPARGVYVQRVKVVEYDGSVDEAWWVYTSPGYEGYALTTADLLPGMRSKGYCNRFPVHSGGSTDAGVWLGADNSIIYMHSMKGVATDLSTWKAWLQANPVILVYQLAEPIETALTTEEVQAFRALHSNKPTTTVLNDAGAWMAVEYAADPKLYIDRKIAELVAANNT